MSVDPSHFPRTTDYGANPGITDPRLAETTKMPTVEISLEDTTLSTNGELDLSEVFDALDLATNNDSRWTELFAFETEPNSSDPALAATQIINPISPKLREQPKLLADILESLIALILAVPLIAPINEAVNSAYDAIDPLTTTETKLEPSLDTNTRGTAESLARINQTTIETNEKSLEEFKQELLQEIREELKTSLESLTHSNQISNQPSLGPGENLMFSVNSSCELAKKLTQKENPSLEEIAQACQELGLEREDYNLLLLQTSFGPIIQQNAPELGNVEFVAVPPPGKNSGVPIIYYDSNHNQVRFARNFFHNSTVRNGLMGSVVCTVFGASEKLSDNSKKQLEKGIEKMAGYLSIKPGIPGSGFRT